MINNIIQNNLLVGLQNKFKNYNNNFEVNLYINIINENLIQDDILIQEFYNQFFGALSNLDIPVIEHFDDRKFSNQIFQIFDNQEEHIVIGDPTFIRTMYFDETSNDINTFKGQINGYDFYENPFIKNEDKYIGEYMIFPTEYFNINIINESILKLEENNEILYSLELKIDFILPKKYKILKQTNK